MRFMMNIFQTLKRHEAHAKAAASKAQGFCQTQLLPQLWQAQHLGELPGLLSLWELARQELSTERPHPLV